MKKFLLDYWAFLKKYRAWVLFPLAAFALFLLGTLLLSGDRLPVYFTYAIF